MERVLLAVLLVLSTQGSVSCRGAPDAGDADSDSDADTDSDTDADTSTLPDCSIDITPAAYNFGSGVTGSTRGATMEMRLSDHCGKVRLLGMRIVDAAGADPQAAQLGALGSLCVSASDASGEPEPQDAACASGNCLMGGARVARCVDACETDADCGNGIRCQEDAGGNKICWPLSPWENAGRGGGSDFAVMHYGTRKDRDGQPGFPEVLESHADNDPDGWITTTFTCTDQPASNRQARVEVLWDLEDDVVRRSYADLQGRCTKCPVALASVSQPPIDMISPLDTVMLDGSASHSPSGLDLRYHWYFNQAPADSHTGYRPECNPSASRTLDSCSTSARPAFFVDLMGTYEPCLEVCEVNSDGTQGTCTSDPECGGDACLTLDPVCHEAIHIQLVWDHPETDVDLHYIRSGAVYGDTTADSPGGDCHFANPRPDYCAAGDASGDPSLDIDDTEGYGPENINHNEPCDDVYRLWASYKEDHGRGSTRAKVRVFLKGMLVSETTHVLDRRNCHWLVGRITWSGDSGSFESEPDGNNDICGLDNPEQ